MSNELMVSGRRVEDGPPIAVFGPQTAYYTPAASDGRGRARARHGRPRRDLRRHQPLRAAGPRRDYRLERHLGRPDIIDTYAVPLCEPGRVEAGRSTSSHYRFHGQCLPIDVMEKTNSWTPARPTTRRPVGDAPRRAHQLAS
jgi:hypothetical protein